MPDNYIFLSSELLPLIDCTFTKQFLLQYTYL